jgi:two-component system OmpR family response regulator
LIDIESPNVQSICGNGNPPSSGKNDEQLILFCVDDDKDIQSIIRLSLSLDEQVVTRFASDGREALITLARGDYKPDCILLDMRLPDGDGKTLMGEIRTLPGLLETPIIFLTASVRPLDVADVMSLGAIGILAKPFDPLELARQIRALISPDHSAKVTK